MCGCASGKGASACSGNKKQLRVQRNRLVTLYNTTTDLAKKQEYKNLLTEIDSLTKTTVCPDQNTITSIKNYISLEYTIHNQ